MTNKNYKDIQSLPYGFKVGSRYYETICFWDRYTRPDKKVKDKSKVLLRNIDTNADLGTTLPFHLHPETEYKEYNKEEWERALKERHGKSLVNIYV